MSQEVEENRQTLQNAEQRVMDLRLILRTLREITDILGTAEMFLFPFHALGGDKVHFRFAVVAVEDNPKQWVIDEPAAQTVRKIFALCLAGKGPMQIARQLEGEKILSPAVYFESISFTIIVLISPFSAIRSIRIKFGLWKVVPDTPSSTKNMVLLYPSLRA